MPTKAHKSYRLYDGTIGTEYEALVEAIKILEAKKQDLEGRLELLHQRLQIAEGHP
jgi:hypothetical protein